MNNQLKSPTMQEKLKAALAECIKNFENENAVTVSFASMTETINDKDLGEPAWDIEAQILSH